MAQEVIYIVARFRLNPFRFDDNVYYRDMQVEKFQDYEKAKAFYKYLNGEPFDEICNWWAYRNSTAETDTWRKFIKKRTMTRDENGYIVCVEMQNLVKKINIK